MAKAAIIGGFSPVTSWGKKHRWKFPGAYTGFNPWFLFKIYAFCAKDFIHESTVERWISSVLFLQSPGYKALIFIGGNWVNTPRLFERYPSGERPMDLLNYPVARY